jgi:hypothetical protein
MTPALDRCTRLDAQGLRHCHPKMTPALDRCARVEWSGPLPLSPEDDASSGPSHPDGHVGRGQVRPEGHEGATSLAVAPRRVRPRLTQDDRRLAFDRPTRRANPRSSEELPISGLLLRVRLEDDPDPGSTVCRPPKRTARGRAEVVPGKKTLRPKPSGLRGPPMNANRVTCPEGQETAEPRPSLAFRNKCEHEPPKRSIQNAVRMREFRWPKPHGAMAIQCTRGRDTELR